MLNKVLLVKVLTYFRRMAKEVIKMVKVVIKMARGERRRINPGR